MAGKPSPKHKGRLQPGESGNPNGRPKGIPNKITTDIKKFILDTANRFNDDPEKAIDSVDKNLFWGTIFPKIIPKDLNLQVQLWTRQLSDEDLAARIEQLMAEREGKP